MVIERSKNPEAFIGFERAGWDANIAGYDQAFGSVSRQTVGPLLKAANVSTGTRVLDVCTDPGMLVEAAIERGAQAVGLDFSAHAVELAQRQVPAGEFHQGRCAVLALKRIVFFWMMLRNVSVRDNDK